MSINRIGRAVQGHRAGDLISRLTEKAYSLRVGDKITGAGNHEATSRNRTPAEVRLSRVPGEHQPTPNRSRATGWDPHRAALAATMVAAMVAPPTVPTEEAVAEEIAEAEATRTATLPATNAVATTPATAIRHAKKRLPTLVTAASPPNHDFTLYYFPKSSSLSGSTSTTRSKIQFSGSGVMPWPLRMC
jgi:hypothetical protein